MFELVTYQEFSCLLIYCVIGRKCIMCLKYWIDTFDSAWYQKFSSGFFFTLTRGIIIIHATFDSEHTGMSHCVFTGQDRLCFIEYYYILFIQKFRDAWLYKTIFIVVCTWQDNVYQRSQDCHMFYLKLADMQIYISPSLL